MAQVAEKLSILKMTSEERANYSYYQKKLYNDRDELKAAEARGEAKGEEKGRAKGRTEEKIKIAKNLLAQGVGIETICAATGLSVREITELSSASSRPS